MTVVLGLLAAVFWGVTDFLGGPAARRVGVAHVVFVSNVIGLVAVAAAMIVWAPGRDKLFTAPGIGIAFSLAGALCLLAATSTLSRALRSGRASIIAPIAMSYGVVTTALSYFSGETISTLHLVGIGICVAGIPLTGMSSQRSGSTSDSTTHSVLLAVAAMLCFGVSYWLQGRFAVPRVGALGYLLINYLCVAALTGAYLYISWIRSRGKEREPPLRRYPLVVAQGVMSLLGLACFSWGMASGITAVVAVLSTFSGAVTAVLARILRHEELRPVQWLGICIVIFGTCVVRL